MNEISEGKKAIEAEIRELVAEAGLTSITFAWEEYGHYFNLTTSFGDYRIEWPFSKAQLEAYSSYDAWSHISNGLKQNISSLLT